MFFSARCPLLNWDLPFFQRLWYSYAAWAPFCTTVTVPGMMVAPFLSVAFGLHPLAITFHFVLASTLYFTFTLATQFYVRSAAHLKLVWFANLRWGWCAVLCCVVLCCDVLCSHAMTWSVLGVSAERVFLDSVLTNADQRPPCAATSCCGSHTPRPS